MQKRFYISVSFLLLFCIFLVANNYMHSDRPPAAINCNIQNEAIGAGEELVYEIYYNWGFIWLSAGKVVFTVKKDTYKEIPCYNITGIGNTYPSYDWIYKVRDRFECWVDTLTLKPFRYVRDVKEGGRTFYNDCYFNYSKGKAYCVTSGKNKSPKLDTVSITACSLDPLSMIYYARNADFSKCKVNDTVPISLFLDSKVYSLYMRYLGKDKLTLDDNRVFNCIKFSPLLIEGTIFKGGEGMVVWATDDKNRIPLYVEAPIIVGNVKAKIVSWKGLKNKIESQIK